MDLVDLLRELSVLEEVFCALVRLEQLNVLRIRERRGELGYLDESCMDTSHHHEAQFGHSIGLHAAIRIR